MPPFCLTLTAGDSTGKKMGCDPPFQFRYLLASSLYGTTPLARVLPEVPKVGAKHLDIWPRVHGNQREQAEAMGHDAFLEMLETHGVKLGVSTRFDLGPFGLDDEIRFLRAFDAELVVCGSGGPADLEGEDLRRAVKQFVARQQPQLDLAEALGVRIGIENHASWIVDSLDSMRWLAEFAGSRPLGIALAPYHLPDDPERVAQLIRDLDDKLFLFYAWQHGKGSHGALKPEEILLQMPGRGPLDFAPIVSALKEIEYAGWTEVFMHPAPRGIPIREPIAEVAVEVNRAREYLEACLS